MNKDNRVQLFPPELRTMSVVPRWSVVWTLMHDTVANHSYYVAMYAHALARLIEWRGDCAALLYLALTHDLDETVTGDIVSPVKDAIIDAERAGSYIDLKMHERLPGIIAEIDHYTAGEFTDYAASEFIDGIWRIIKVADRLDALLFLVGERRMGNNIVKPRIMDAERRLYAAFMELPRTKQELNELWQTVMLMVIASHGQIGGNGV